MDPSGYTEMSLHKAVIDGMTDVVEAILVRGADPNQRDDATGRTPAHCAVQMGNLSMLQLLKEYGADMSIYDYRCSTPLWEAVERGKTEAARWLLNNLPRNRDVTTDMLSLAAACGQVNVMSMLLERGADMESKDDLGRNALFHAAENGKSAAVSFLLQRGANSAVCDDYKKTLLHAVAGSGDPKTIHLVLQHCLDKMHSRDCSGDTPLHCAATTSREAVSILLDLGADIDSKNRREYTALDLAKEAKNAEVVDLLQCVLYQLDDLTKRLEKL